MEILALLLLGFIAMLAIVPPIIRGRLEDSPLSTTQSFQRSMKEMAHSIEPHGGPEQTSYETRRGDGAEVTEYKARYLMGTAPMRPSRRSSAAVRRNRITVFLTIFAAMWGVATLVSGSAWCLAIFAIATFLLVVYWAMAIIIPSTSSKARSVKSSRRIPAPPKSQAS